MSPARPLISVLVTTLLTYIRPNGCERHASGYERRK